MMAGAVLLGGVSDARAQAEAATETPTAIVLGGDRRCLWQMLPVVDRLRLEVAARAEEGLPPSVIQRLGESGLTTILGRCGLSYGEFELALMARYWMARATLEVAMVELDLAGVEPQRADTALLVTAPFAERAALSLEIIGGNDDLAGPSIRAAIQTLDILGPKLTEPQKQRLAEYFSARIIADGLEAGATPAPRLPSADGANGAADQGAAETPAQ